MWRTPDRFVHVHVCMQGSLCINCTCFKKHSMSRGGHSETVVLIEDDPKQTPFRSRCCSMEKGDYFRSTRTRAPPLWSMLNTTIAHQSTVLPSSLTYPSFAITQLWYNCFQTHTRDVLYKEVCFIHFLSPSTPSHLYTLYLHMDMYIQCGVFQLAPHTLYG